MMLRKYSFYTCSVSDFKAMSNFFGYIGNEFEKRKAKKVYLKLVYEDDGEHLTFHIWWREPCIKHD